MKTFISQLTALSVIGLALAGPGVPVAKARDQEEGYWGHYWRWYDETYQPYYNRRFRNRTAPGYVYPSATIPYYYGGHETYGPSATYPYTGRSVPDPMLRLGWW